MAGVDLRRRPTGSGQSSAIQKDVGAETAPLRALSGLGQATQQVGGMLHARATEKERQEAEAEAAFQAERQKIHDSSVDGHNRRMSSAVASANVEFVINNPKDHEAWQKNSRKTWDDAQRAFESSVESVSPDKAVVQRNAFLSAREKDEAALRLQIATSEQKQQIENWKAVATDAAKNNDWDGFQSALNELPYSNDPTTAARQRSELEDKIWGEGLYDAWSLKIGEVNANGTTRDFEAIEKELNDPENPDSKHLKREQKNNLLKVVSGFAIKKQKTYNRTLAGYLKDADNAEPIDNYRIDNDINTGVLDPADRPIIEMLQSASVEKGEMLSRYETDQENQVYVSKLDDIVKKYLDGSTDKNIAMDAEARSGLFEEIDGLKGLGVRSRAELYVTALQAQTNALAEPDNSWGIRNIGSKTMPIVMPSPSATEDPIGPKVREFRLSYNATLRDLLLTFDMDFPGMGKKFMENEKIISESTSEDMTVDDAKKLKDSLIKPFVEGTMNFQIRQKIQSTRGAKKISSQADFDNLKAGDKFIFNGRVGTKR